jgi:hypothetical protein
MHVGSILKVFCIKIQASTEPVPFFLYFFFAEFYLNITTRTLTVIPFTLFSKLKKNTLRKIQH